MYKYCNLFGAKKTYSKPFENPTILLHDKKTMLNSDNPEQNAPGGAVLSRSSLAAVHVFCKSKAHYPYI